MGEKRRRERDEVAGERKGSSLDHKHRKSNDGGSRNTVVAPEPFKHPRMPHVPSTFPSSKPSGSGGLPPPPLISNDRLRAAVFVHPGTRSNKDASARDDSMTYEQLEFLGDAYIEVIATRLIHARFPVFNVGERSQAREDMVKNETLAGFSRRYGWDKPGVIKLAGKEREEGGKAWVKILGDVMEAYVGAVVEDDSDSGFEVAERWLTALWEPQLSKLGVRAGQNPRVNVGELKDRLQNLLMNPKAGVKIKWVDAVPPREDRANGRIWTVRELRLTGWGHEDKVLGCGEASNGKVADGLAVQDAFNRNMDLIMEANAKKREFERIAREAKEAEAAVAATAAAQR